MKSTEPESAPSPLPVPDPPSAHRRERRALRVGFAVSLVLHLVAIAFYPLLMDRLVPTVAPLDPLEIETALPGIEVLDLREVAEAPEPDAPAVAEDPTLVVVAPDLDPGDPEDEVDPAPPEIRPSAAELLRPRMGDPRLWVPMDRDVTAMTDHERAELLLRGMIQSWNDSVAVAVALSDAARDWTYTDDEGRRWGLSPGRLHLGDFSIPLPFSFQGQTGLLEDRLQREWELQDLARAAQSAAIRETWAERAREIRRRMEEERRQPPGEGGNR
jgi:hypothetical protein